MIDRNGNTLSLSEEDILVGRSEASPTATDTPGQPAPSVIGKGVVFTGNIVAKGCLEIEGELQGNVECLSLVTGDDSLINGSVTAESLLVSGRLIGPIRANRLIIQSGAHVEGDIQYSSLRIDNDTFIEGQLRHSENPLLDDTSLDASPPKPANVVSIAQDTTEDTPQNADVIPRPAGAAVPIKAPA